MPDVLEPFLGLWVDAHGRALLVRRRSAPEQGQTQHPVLVTVTHLGRAGGTAASAGSHIVSPAGLPGELFARVDGTRLEVEAGVIGLGPTYVLERTDDDRLLPQVRMGLYDEWEADLGVPWAFPLEPYRRATPEEHDRIGGAR